MKIKQDVFFHPRTFSNYHVPRILYVAEQQAPPGYEPTVTSAGDGHAHRPNSLHNKGRAFDFRTRDLAPETVGAWAKRIQAVLGGNYRALVEKDHIHVGYYGPGAD